MDATANPHDKLFKETWSDKAAAQDFLRHYLPQDVAAQIDLATLEVRKDSFVDPALQESFSDLLYTVTLTGQVAYVYLLFEHKSYPSPHIHLQLLEYMLRIWQLHLKQADNRRTPVRLPVVIPLVLYHGRTTWNTSLSFADLFAESPHPFARYIPDFRYVLHDVSRYSDEEITGTVMSQVALLLFKHIFDPDLAGKLPDILALMRDVVRQDQGLRALETVLRYLSSATDTLTTEEVVMIMEQTFADTGGRFAMTLVEQWKQEGYEQGLVEAIELGISLKFGDEKTRRLMPAIQTIHNLSRLHAIKEAIRQAQDIAELNALIMSTN